MEIGASAGGDFHLEGKCDNFPQDIEVTDDDGTTLLDFWIEDIAADPIVMHVKVDDDLGSNQTVRVYYGKSGATTNSDIGTTFLFGDDFEDASIDTSKWTGDTGYATITDGIMIYYSGTTTARELKSIINFPPSVILQSERKFSGDGSSSDSTGFGFITTDAVTKIYHYADKDSLNRINVGANYANTNLPEYSYHKFELKTDSDTPITSWYSNDIQSSGSPITVATTSTNLNVYMYSRTAAYNQYKYIFVRKYNDPEPAFASAGAEQNAPTAGATMNQFQKANIGADLYNGAIIA